MVWNYYGKIPIVFGQYRPSGSGPTIEALFLKVNISESKDRMMMKFGMGVLLGGLVKLPGLEKIWVPTSGAYNLSAFKAVSQKLKHLEH